MPLLLLLLLLKPSPTVMSAPPSSGSTSAPPTPRRLACPLISLGDMGLGDMRAGEATGPGPERARLMGNEFSPREVRRPSIDSKWPGLRLSGMDSSAVLVACRAAP